ncbi:hypothetical protein HanIR_Chr16g0789101 [Helianthus annuus]|nr:hypothetical protein HanIR_Chr16g0789101 [Helianthus annuus]
MLWRRIREKFFTAMDCGEYHTPDSFPGKWTAMRTKIFNFNNIYICISNNHTRVSGSNDVDIMTATHNEYKIHTGSEFTMIPCR